MRRPLGAELHEKYGAGPMRCQATGDARMAVTMEQDSGSVALTPNRNRVRGRVSASNPAIPRQNATSSKV